MLPLEAAALILVVTDPDFQENILKQLSPKTYFKSGRYRIYGHKYVVCIYLPVVKIVISVLNVPRRSRH